MTSQRQMRILIYKTTHKGDPDPITGVFGNNGCMGRVRSWRFSAVIGVGGIGSAAKRNGIARKLTWLGIRPQNNHKDEMDDDGNPLVTFVHFRYFGEDGPLLDDVAPALARRMYGGNARALMDSLSPAERREAEKILDRVRDAPPSGHLKGLPQRNFKDSSGKCNCSISGFPRARE